MPKIFVGEVCEDVSNAFGYVANFFGYFTD